MKTLTNDELKISLVNGLLGTSRDQVYLYVGSSTGADPFMMSDFIGHYPEDDAYTYLKLPTPTTRDVVDFTYTPRDLIVDLSENVWLRADLDRFIDDLVTHRPLSNSAARLEFAMGIRPRILQLRHDAARDNWSRDVNSRLTAAQLIVSIVDALENADSDAERLYVGSSSGASTRISDDWYARNVTRGAVDLHTRAAREGDSGPSHTSQDIARGLMTNGGCFESLIAFVQAMVNNEDLYVYALDLGERLHRLQRDESCIRACLPSPIYALGVELARSRINQVPVGAMDPN